MEVLLPIRGGFLVADTAYTLSQGMELKRWGSGEIKRKKEKKIPGTKKGEIKW